MFKATRATTASCLIRSMYAKGLKKKCYCSKNWGKSVFDVNGGRGKTMLKLTYALHKLCVKHATRNNRMS